MKRLLLILTALPFISLAQTGLSTPNPFAAFDFLNKSSIYQKPDLIEEGTFLYPAQATQSYITLKNGRSYSGLKAMINLMDNELLFQDSLGQNYSAIVPIAKIELIENNQKTLFKTGYPAVDKFNDNTYYQVLSEGKVSLLKAYNITYTDRTTIQSSVPIRHYYTKEYYYLYDAAHGMRPFQKNKTDITGLFRDQEQLMNDYLKMHKTNFKSDSDLAQLVSYYNSL